MKCGWITALALLASPLVGAIDVIPYIQQPQYQNMVISPTGEYLAMIVKAEDKEYPFKTELLVLDLTTRKYTTSLRFPGALSVEDIQWLNNERIMIRAAKKYSEHEQPFYEADIVAINFDGKKQMTIFGPHAGSGTHQSSGATEDFGNMTVLRRIEGNDKQVLIQKRPWGRNVNHEVKTTVAMLNHYTARQSEARTVDIREAGVTLDRADQIRFARRATQDGFSELYYRNNDAGDWQQLFRRGNSQGSWVPLAFNADNSAVLTLTNQDTETDALAWYDVPTKQFTPVFRSERADIDRLYWTADGSEPYAFSTRDGYPSIQLLNSEVPEAKLLSIAAAGLPNHHISFTSYTDDRSKAVVVVSSDVKPAVFYLLDGGTRKAMMLGEARPALKGVQLANMKPVDITARDGKRLPSLLTVPAGKEAKSLPAVVLIHGGPYGITDSWGFDSEVQWLAAAGYAVLQVNYRGSGGFGKAFQYDAYGNWGTTMQDDIVDATNWLGKQGVADPDRICLMGHSYGGYATAWGLSRDPALYRCGIASMGVYDLTLMHEEGDIQKSNYGRSYLVEAIGTDPTALAARSPAHHVDSIKAPLLISHGTKDERVPIEHAKRLIAALKKAKKPYDYLEFEGEGHGFANEANRAKFASTVIAFLDQHTAKR